MTGSTYETHVMPDPLLPFIFHRNTTVPQNGFSNWHENIEILCATSGSGFVNSNSRQYPFEEQDIFVVNSDDLHTTFTNTHLTYHCLIIDKSFCESNGIPTSRLRFQSLIQDSMLFAAFGKIADAFSRYNDQEDSFAIVDIRYEILGFLRSLLAGYLETSSTQDTSLSSIHVKKAIIFIRARITENLTLQKIADHVGISRFHLSREFKSITGYTIIETINMIRCTEARNMIEQGSSVSSAALSCGFDNLSYFSRTFKKHFGELPSQFRSTERKSD